MGIKAAKTMTQSEKGKKKISWGICGKTQPISALVHQRQHGHVWWVCWGLYSGDLQRSFHSSVLLHHVRMVSSISSLESGRLEIFFNDRRWHSDSRSLLAESRMAVIVWFVERAKVRIKSVFLYMLQRSVNDVNECVVWPAWFPLPGGVAAGWRWCVRSELWRWCSCPWCCPADSSTGAWRDWPPWRGFPGLWTPTTAPALIPVWCHLTDSEDSVRSHIQQTSQHKTSTYDTLLKQLLITVFIFYTHYVFIYSYLVSDLIFISQISAFFMRF